MTRDDTLFALFGGFLLVVLFVSLFLLVNLMVGV
jgi:hypothetical protein